MTRAQFLFLSQEEVIEAGGLDMPATIEAVEEALVLLAEGKAILPPKTSILWGEGIDTQEREGRIMAMPAWVGGGADVAGIKWIPSVPDNPSRGLPRGIGLIILTDRETGLPLAVMDGTVVSAMRTGAVTGVAARRLARPRARVAALLGAGVQARTQRMALDAVLPELEEIRVWDIDPNRAAAFAQGNARMVTAETAEAACRDADVVVPVTLAPEPFVKGEWLAEGSLFVSVSSLDPELSCLEVADLLVCDSWSHETEFAPRPFARALAVGAISRDDVLELPDILSGRHPGRADDRQRVFLSPVGLAVEDVAAAARVWRRAVDLGLGTPLDLWQSPIWS